MPPTPNLFNMVLPKMLKQRIWTVSVPFSQPGASRQAEPRFWPSGRLGDPRPYPASPQSNLNTRSALAQARCGGGGRGHASPGGSPPTVASSPTPWRGASLPHSLEPLPQRPPPSPLEHRRDSLRRRDSFAQELPAPTWGGGLARLSL